MQLKDKVSIITGGASGFGAAGALRFAQAGSAVVVADLNEELGEKVVEELLAEGHVASFVRTDVTSEEDSRRLVETTMERYGRLDVLWANAGLAHGAYAVDEIDLGLFDTLMRVNVLGPILNVRAALPALKESRGNVVITASLSGIKGRPDLSIYQSSKGAAVMLTRSLAAELGQFGIRVNSVCPLASNTAMMSTFLENRPQDPVAFLEAVAQSVPLGRLVSPDDVAYAALFLASDHAGMVTGVNLPVDGGAST